MILLIDGDILMYRACFSLERFLDKGEKVTAGLIKWQIDKYIDQIHQGVSKYSSKPIKGYRVFITEDNFRKLFATIAPYKGHRPDRPQLYDMVKEYMLTICTWLDIPLASSIEADDMLGIAANMLRERGVDYVICSIDKDLKQIQGKHYSWNPKGSLSEADCITNVSEAEGLKYLYEQALTGDSVDNIKGLKGYGKVRALKVLDGLTEPSEMFEACLEEYRKTDTDTPLADLLETLNLVYIMQSERFYRCPV